MWLTINSPPLLFRVSDSGAHQMLLTSFLLQKIYQRLTDCRGVRLKVISMPSSQPLVAKLEPYWKCNISSLESLSELSPCADLSCAKEFFRFLNWFSRLWSLSPCSNCCSCLTCYHRRTFGDSVIVGGPSSRTWNMVYL